MYVAIYFPFLQLGRCMVLELQLSVDIKILQKITGIARIDLCLPTASLFYSAPLRAIAGPLLRQMAMPPLQFPAKEKAGAAGFCI
ncbi:hypothetical protein [Cupriavidus consociatus]|uniref:hypothetical protein n=1 Tax=Cupriavidus consociatus TaxID=2821357 RepID=UPI001AE6890B|nr:MULTISPECIES: hypothetical protein [unclassified Cupriavidus]MBP0619769.1 hypothetical protein [Cupriavidus sp. LEh25]MDK2656421.1 hypothetical protein [Cupriavidus sp. LEh21]